MVTRATSGVDSHMTFVAMVAGSLVVHGRPFFELIYVALFYFNDSL